MSGDPGDLAGELWRARVDGLVYPRSVAAAVADEAAAYAVQRDAVARSGLARTGWKVACTSETAKTVLGVAGPSLAPVLDTLTLVSPAEVAVFPAQGPAVEGEFAFRLGRDLPPRKAAYHRDEVLAAVAAAHPAIEVVASRFEGGFEGAGDVITVLDFCFNVALVLGPAIADWTAVDFSTAPVRMLKDSVVGGEGTGAAALGHPFHVLEWTANKASALGVGLLAGEVISTGTCSGIVYVQPGDAVVGDYGPQGRVEITFTDAGG